MATTSFFVSYTGADTAWAEWIAWQLEAVGYQATLQAWDSRPGNDFVVWMDRAIRDAERIVVVLTPAYQEATSFTVPEWSAAIGRDPTGELGVLVPIRVADFTPEGLLRTRGWIDLVGKDRVAAKATLLAGVVQGRMKPKEEPVFPGERPPEPAFPGPTEPGRAILNLPPRNLNFTGRDDLLRQLAEQLTVGTATAVVQAQAVHGLGGVGKTQLAIEYAHRHQADYDLIWWITADQPLAIPGQLVALARRLGLADAPEQAETIRSLWDELRRRDRWLLIFDNAEQLADLRPLWPPGGSGHVLVTSRNPVWRGLAEPLAVDVLAREQAVTFLARRTGSQDSGSLDALAEVLGGPALGAGASQRLYRGNRDPNRRVRQLVHRARS